MLGESTPQVLGTQTLANTGAKLQPMQWIMPLALIGGTAALAYATRRRSFTK